MSLESDAARRTPRSSVIPSDLVPESAGTVAFFGSQSRQGHWLLPRLFRVVSMFGNVKIDLTSARVGAGTSRIEVRVIFGNIEIIVPPEMRVEADGTGFLGNFATDVKVHSPLSPDAPLISIGGSAFLGNVEVRIVDPDAPTWLDKITARLSGERVPYRRQDDGTDFTK